MGCEYPEAFNFVMIWMNLTIGFFLCFALLNKSMWLIHIDYFSHMIIHESILDLQMEDLDAFMSSQDKSRIDCNSVL